MRLYRLEDLNSNYRQKIFDGADIQRFDVYAASMEDKIGTVDNLLVDEAGNVRYLVLDTGLGIFGKKVLLPVDFCHFENNAHRVYARGIRNKEQLEKLPRYEDGMAIDYDYEDELRNAYRTPTVEGSLPVEMSLPVESGEVRGTTKPQAVPGVAEYTPENHDTYTYEEEPSLYQTNDRDRQTIQLYEERLTADKTWRKSGEVKIGKRVETDIVRASVPIEKEQVIIERLTPEDAGTPVPSNPNIFQAGEVVNLEVYEETADLKKQAFVREEVKIRKEMARDTVETTEKLRREKLDIDTEGSLDIDQST